jgi:hypothetical protein
MRTTTSTALTGNTAPARTAGPSDRRTHVRLRDLCDEVLASFRLASEGEMFSAQERAEGLSLMGRITRKTAR